MKKPTLRTKIARGLGGRSRGMTLIEVLIALALFTIIAIVFISGLTVAARSVFIGDQRTTAESLARAQLEYVKNQQFSDPPWGYELTSSMGSCVSVGGEQLCPDWWSENPEIPPKLDSMYRGYTVMVEAENLYDAVGEKLDGIQQIRVTVSRDGQRVFALEGYNMDR